MTDNDTGRSSASATEAHDTFIRSLRAQVCPWCGIRCNTRAEHEHLARQSETTWRRAAA